jgi:hypothetical protein
MKLGYYLLLFISASIGIHAELNEKAHLAEMYFEAKEYVSAESLYREILKGKLAPKERAIMTYNLASTLLHEERWDEAIEIFKSVEGQGLLSDYYSYRYYVNSVVAQWNKGYGDYKELSENQESFTKDAKEVLELMQEIFKNVQKASHQYKDLHDDGTRRDPELVTLVKQMKTVFGEIQERLYIYQMERLSVEEGLSLLIRDLEESLKVLQILQSAVSRVEAERDFLQLFAEEERKVDPIWNVLRERLEKEDKPEDAKAFAKAHNNHIAALELMDEGVAGKSYNRQKKAYDILVTLQEEQKQEGEDKDQDQKQESNANGSQDKMNAANEGKEPEEEEAGGGETEAQNEVLALLQEMQYDDEDKKEKSAPVKQGLRPW